MSLPELNLNKEILGKLGLNEKQLEAALYFDSPLLILAGAGTGKTKTLISKIALMINSGVKASRILAITFTNKAAQEMRERIARIAPESAGLWVYTFHAFGARILRQHWQKAGLKKDFTIYDEEDQKKLIKNAAEELGFEKETAKAAVYASLISRAKDDMLDAQSYLIHARVSNDINRIRAGQIYLSYEKKLAESNAVDFGDLIMKTVKLIRDDEDIKNYYQEYFRYILVDEYQDTNRAQYFLVKLLSEKHHNVCVVGDPDQSIYSWRGANIRNILDFEKDFKDAKTVVLEQNYRSTSSILDAANKLIRHNRSRKEKNLWTANGAGEKISLLECFNETDEASIAAKKAQEIKNKGGNYGDFAVFYRTNAQSRNFEEAFRKHKIPYKLIGSVRFYERREIKDALAYLRILVNPSDSVSLERIINIPARGIGPKALESIKSHSSNRGLPLYQSLLCADEIEGLAPSVRKGIRDFIRIFEDLKSDIFADEPHYVLEKLLAKSGYWQMTEESAQKDPQDALNRLGNLQELVNAVKDFEENCKKRNEEPSIEKYLEEITLQSEVDNLNENSDSVTLMTLHLAKGLEFPSVMLTGLEEGLFPINAAACDEDDMEEERRLMYVGMTRAKKKLYLSWAQTRRIFGKTYPNLMSRFVFEAKVADFSKNKEPESEKIIKAYEAPKPAACSGRKVAHPLYGLGKIAAVAGTGEFTKVTVVFDNGVRQTFMLKFAPLEML
ncbi:MAG: UvrD-helicase domain-containing protein [Elusimicrobiota bacterium]